LGKGEDGRIPLSRSFEPSEIPELAPMIGMVHVVREASRLRFRHGYTGSAIIQQVSNDPSGLWFEQVYSGKYLREAHVTYVEITAIKKPQVLQRAFPLKKGKILLYDRLLLPLAGKDQLVDTIVYQPVFLGVYNSNEPGQDPDGIEGLIDNGKTGSVAAE
jgi:hypothetical protein